MLAGIQPDPGPPQDPWPDPPPPRPYSPKPLKAPPPLNLAPLLHPLPSDPDPVAAPAGQLGIVPALPFPQLPGQASDAISGPGGAFTSLKRLRDSRIGKDGCKGGQEGCTEGKQVEGKEASLRSQQSLGKQAREGLCGKQDGEGLGEAALVLVFTAWAYVLRMVLVLVLVCLRHVVRAMDVLYLRPIFCLVGLGATLVAAVTELMGALEKEVGVAEEQPVQRSGGDEGVRDGEGGDSGRCMLLTMRLTERRPLLQPQRPEHRGKLTVVLDLDETLVCAYNSAALPASIHSQAVNGAVRWFEIACKATEKDANGQSRTNLVTVYERPGLGTFLQRASQIAELVLFTAGLEGYASPLIDRIDPHGLFTARLYRPATVSTHVREHVKDLSWLGRDLHRTLLVDNNPYSFMLQPANGIPCLPFTGEQPCDRQLLDVLLPLLESLAEKPDIRPALVERFRMPMWFQQRGILSSPLLG